MTLSGDYQDFFYSIIINYEVDGLLVKVYIICIDALIGVEYV